MLRTSNGEGAEQSDQQHEDSLQGQSCQKLISYELPVGSQGGLGKDSEELVPERTRAMMVVCCAVVWAKCLSSEVGVIRQDAAQWVCKEL